MLTKDFKVNPAIMIIKRNEHDDVMIRFTRQQEIYFNGDVPLLLQKAFSFSSFYTKRIHQLNETFPLLVYVHYAKT